MKIQRTRGFTLIELVVVIVILGILAAFVIPRFARLDKDARVAVVEALGGSMKGAASLAHSLSLTKALSGDGKINMEGQDITMVHYYPTADDKGILEAVGGETRGFTVTTSEAGVVFTKDGAPSVENATCSVTYKAASSGTSPTIMIDTSGC